MPYRWIDAALAQLLREGIEPYEAMQVLAARHRRPLPGWAGNRVRVLTVQGRTAAGRDLLVMLRHEGGWEWVIVGARDLTSDERAELREWERGRDEEH